jgi:hypothetical protein
MTLLLFHLFLSPYIIAIIAIITLLFDLFLHQTIMTIITFNAYYDTYFCMYILL